VTSTKIPNHPHFFSRSSVAALAPLVVLGSLLTSSCTQRTQREGIKRPAAGKTGFPSHQIQAQPGVEEYATIKAITNGIPVWSLSNLTYIYGVSPDFTPGIVMQEGNRHPLVKIQPKKSWEIKSNYAGSQSEMMPRSAYNDSQPMLPIHLIDGDPNTAWSCFEMTAAKARPEWIRIDLPIESEVASVTLITADYHNHYYGNYGKALPKELEVKTSPDALHWETVYSSNQVKQNQRMVEIRFKPRPAKQIWIIGNDFPKLTSISGNNMRYLFSIGEVEVRDPSGVNLALLSRGGNVTVSSTSYVQPNDRFTQDALWNSLNYDLGNKWVAVDGDNGPYMWHYVEHEKGKLEIDPVTDQSVTELVRHGVNFILTLDEKGNWIYENPPRKTNWPLARFREINDIYNDHITAADANPEMYQAWLRYIEYMARHFKDRVAYFAIGSEWQDGILNVGPPEHFLKTFLEPALEVVKRVAPNAKVMLGGIGGFVPDAVLDCLGRQRKNGPPNPVQPGLASRIDALSWHPGNEPNAKYFEGVRELQKQCRALGFQGRFFATQVFAGSMYPPGPQPGNLYLGSETQMAKYFAKSLIGHSGVGMEAGPCHPHFTAFAHPQALCQTMWGMQTLNPCRPTMTYYWWRTMASAMDSFEPVAFPVKFSAERDLLYFTFQRGEHERMVGVWIDGPEKDGIAQTKEELRLLGVQAKQGAVVDIMNGTEQVLDLSTEGGDTVLRGMLIKDYPVLIRISW